MEQFETVIVGGGQAALATAYHLQKRGRPFVILEANERIGDSWRKRWDSLRLFTPAKYDGLPGMRFPAPRWSFPTKDEMGDYLESYASQFEFPLRTGVSVDRVFREHSHYVVESGHRTYEAENVIVATGAHRIPRRPHFAPELDRGIVQLHSAEYRNPSQLGGGVLVVGVGNSGAELAYELSRTHRVWQAGAPSTEIPLRHGSVPFRAALPIIRFVGTHVLSGRTPVGRKVRPKFVRMAAPLIRIKSRDLEAAGVERVARVEGVRDGRPLLADGRVLDADSVLWCTGFRDDFSWIDLPVTDENGELMHERGVVPSAPGVYFVGLVFQHAATSDVLPGVGRDAAYVVKRLVGDRRTGPRVTGKPRSLATIRPAPEDGWTASRSST